jgi:hypothetical protein
LLPFCSWGGFEARNSVIMLSLTFLVIISYSHYDAGGDRRCTHSNSTIISTGVMYFHREPPTIPTSLTDRDCNVALQATCLASKAEYATKDGILQAKQKRASTDVTVLAGCAGGLYPAAIHSVLLSSYMDYHSGRNLRRCAAQWTNKRKR